MYITRKNLPSTTTSDVSVLENGCLLTLLWKLGALSGNDLNNATQFSLSFIRKGHSSSGRPVLCRSSILGGQGCTLAKPILPS